MRILAFDTAGNGCTACVWQAGKVLARAGGAMRRGQAEALVPMIEQVMAESATAWAALDRIAVTVGPGSFTGLRVGLATARAMGLAADTPVVGVTTLEAFAHAVPEARRGGTVLAAVDARRADIYLQAFRGDSLEPLAAPLAAAPAAVADLLVGWGAPSPVVACGDGAALLPGGVAEVDGGALIDPAVVAALAARKPVPETAPTALYIRPPDAALPRNGGRLRP